MAILCDLRFDSRPSNRAEQFLRGADVIAYAHFRDALTLEYVAVTGVSAIAYIPGGTELDPAPTVAEVSTGIWSVTVTAAAAVYSGAWRIQVNCTGPTAAVAIRDFTLSDPEPDESAPPSVTYYSAVALVERAEAAILAAEEGGLGYRFSRMFPETDLTGATDVSEDINAFITACMIAGTRGIIGKGIYRADAQIEAATGTDLWVHPEAEIVGHFNSSGRNGLVTLSSANWTSTIAGSLQRGIKIRGGIWRRNGTLSGDGKTWTGNTGSIFSLYGADVEISCVWIKGYHLGRAIQGGGSNWTLDRILCINNDNYLSLPCPGVGGTGMIRWYSSGPMVCTRVFGKCGDDALQVVPQALDLFGEDAANVTYSDCYVESIKARACVCALTIPDDERFDDSDQFSQTISVANVTFRGIRGSAKIACAFYNSDSIGTLGTIMFDDIRLSINADLDGNAAPYAVEILGTDGSAGAGPIIFRDFQLLNRLEGGIRCRGSEIKELVLDRVIIPASSNPDSLYYAMQVQDAESVTMRGGSITGTPGSTKSLVILGRNDEAFNIALARFDGVTFSGIPSVKYAVQGSVYGAVRLEMDACTATPADGVTDARFVLFPDNCTSALITANNLGALGAVPYASIPAGAKFRDNVISSAATNGIIHQQVAADTTIAWNGWSRVLRLSASADVTIDTISLPAGHEITDTPMIALYAINNFSLTLSSAGNIAPAGSTVLTAGTTVLLVYDYVGTKWMQVGHHAPSARTTSTQSAGSGTLTWTSGRALIRINVAGTVTSISGTPTQPDVVTLRAVHTTGTLTIQHGASAIRLKASSNVVLAQNDALTLQYDTSNGYWFEASRSVA